MQRLAKKLVSRSYVDNDVLPGERVTKEAGVNDERPAGIADRVAAAPLRSSASAALSNPPLETCLQRRERPGFAFRRLGSSA